jgi:hypothetical protein
MSPIRLAGGQSLLGLKLRVMSLSREKVAAFAAKQVNRGP